MTDCLWSQNRSFTEFEETLNRVRVITVEYYGKWRPQSNTSTTASSVFHLHNSKAESKSNIKLND